jgi:hypothetical protein
MAKCIRIVGQGVPVRHTDAVAAMNVFRLWWYYFCDHVAYELRDPYDPTGNKLWARRVGRRWRRYRRARAK